MKKVKKSPAEPSELSTFIGVCPQADWDALKSDDAGNTYKKIKEQIIRDQGGLCAYCEVSMDHLPGMKCLENFCVEHFCPKHISGPPNWALEWNNMLGCCKGGASWPDTGQYRSCDALKGGNDYRNCILNPLMINEFDHIFLYDTVTDTEMGKVEVDVANCPPGILALAQNTIAKLGLNVQRLMKLRAAKIDAINIEVEKCLNDGLTMADAMTLIAQAQFGNYPTGWPSFFTLIRYMLQPESDKFLRSIQYDG